MTSPTNLRRTAGRRPPRPRSASDAAAARVAIWRTLALATFGGVVTVAVATSPNVRLAYRSVEGHLVLETAESLVGALVALLAYGRFRRSAALRDLLLAHALALLSVAALVFVSLPLVLGATASSAVTTWAPLVVRLTGAAVLLAAALVPPERTVRARVGREALLVTALLTVLFVTVMLLDSRLPVAVTALPPPEASARPQIEGHGLVLAAQTLGVLCYAGAAAGFLRHAVRRGDEMLGWVAGACALGSWARVNYLLFPSIYSDYLYTGDFLRLGFYLLLLVGAIRELQAYWVAQAEAAVFAERRRLARDLHDGAVQELGFIRRLAREPPLSDTACRQIAAAAERALDEARRAVAALTAPVDEAAGAAVARAVAEVADRYDVPVHVTDALPAASLSPDHREALVRIAREAVSNAARHGRPSGVSVALSEGRLEVRDDGRGFDPTAVRDGRFGLVSMHDRAEGMGGRLAVESAPGEGTTVVVTW